MAHETKEFDVTIEVTAILNDGECPQGQRVGNVFKYPDDVGKICQSAYNAIYPTVAVLRSGGSFPWYDDEDGDGIPDSCSLGCPDYRHPVVFKISRNEK